MSTGTNKERIEQNNESLNSIKTTIDNLPSVELTNTGAKLFSTVEEMNSSTGNTEGDLAVVYKNEMKSVSNGDTITSITFPKTVVFDEAISTSYSGRLRNDSDPEINLNIRLNASSFTLYDMYNTIPQIRYTSSDGITYTRTDDNDDTYEIGGVTVKNLDEHICKFLQINSGVFEGLYSYDTDDITRLKLYNNFKISEDASNVLKTPVGEIQSTLVNTTYNLLAEHLTSLGLTCDSALFKYIDNTHFVAYLYRNNSTTDFDAACLYTSYTNDSNSNLYFATRWSSATEKDIKAYTINVSDNIVTELEIPKTTVTIDSSTFIYDTDEITSDDTFFAVTKNATTINIEYRKYTSDGPDVKFEYGKKYAFAPTQLTATTNTVYSTYFYGKNGVETGTLGQNVSNSFADVNAEIYTMIQQAYDSMEPRVLTNSDKTIDKNIRLIPVNSKGEVLLNTSAVTDMSSMFNGCTNLITIPKLDTSKVIYMTQTFWGCTNLTVIPKLDTSLVTNMYTMFTDCTNLTTIPELDTSLVTNMSYMLQGCTSLSDDSLNNILTMCANATSISSDNKTLKYVGLTEEQAKKCTTLSNWQAFINAGWQAGYASIPIEGGEEE